uniref:Putative septum site-determining protein MinD n=1 Tax=Halochlorococcum sp. NIES-1838 TaxID=2249730 RepID=A0A2Z4MA37_9CHLO|nr:MinD [Halochlorococcum sp. NIES-1838]
MYYCLQVHSNSQSKYELIKNTQVFQFRFDWFNNFGCNVENIFKLKCNQYNRCFKVKTFCQNADSNVSDFKQTPEHVSNFNSETRDTQDLSNLETTPRIMVVTSGKGGVGKTTATANIGMSVARLGYKTVLIDADIGLKNLDLLIGLENRILYTVMDVFEGNCRLDQALIRDKRWKNLCLLSISKNRQRYNVTRENMKNLVQALVNLNFSYIFIDCPAGIDVGFINAISPAKEALIVTTPELPALRDADRVAGLLEANGIYDIKLLVNRVRSDMIQKNDMLSVKDVQEALGIPLLGAIPEDNQIIVSTNFGEPLVLKNKLTLAGIAFENAARRLVGKQDYFVDLETPYKSVFQKMKDFISFAFN